MPCEVKIKVKEAFEGFTVEDDQANVYLDKNNLKLENLTTGPSLFQITVDLDDKNKAVVNIRARDLISVPVSSRYNIPDDCAAEGRIDFPKIAAASQSDLNNLAEEVQTLKESIAGHKRPE